MKTLIKYFMLALSIMQIDAFAIGTSKIINTYRPFSNQEKKQQFQTRGLLVPKVLIPTILCGTIFGGFLYYYDSARTGVTPHQVRKNMKANVKDEFALDIAFGDSNRPNNMTPAWNRNLMRRPDIFTSIGQGTMITGTGVSIGCIVGGLVTRDQEFSKWAVNGTIAAALGAGLYYQTFTRKYITSRD